MDLVVSASPRSLLLALASALVAAAFGPALGRILPFDRRIVLGGLGALAGGVMLGAAYLIMATSMASWPGITPLAAVVTVPLIAVAHKAMRTSPRTDLVARRMALLHGLPEGIALGTALAVLLPLGPWLGITVALHNAAEGALFDERGSSPDVRAQTLGAASLGALLDKMPQALAASLSWLLVASTPVAVAPLLASAFAGLVYLVIAELLPEAYERIGRGGVALTVMAAGAVVATLGGGGALP